MRTKNDGKEQRKGEKTDKQQMKKKGVKTANM